MTSDELRKLNAYPEWKNDSMITAVTNYAEAAQQGNPNPIVIYMQLVSHYI